MSAVQRSGPRRPEPQDAVAAWWRAMQNRDLDELERATLADYLSSGGPDGREIGRDALVDGAAAFFSNATIDEWQVSELELREHGEVAICSYLWKEGGMHDGQPFALRGVATDVLVLRAGRWLFQAHHVSMSPGDP